jgi:uncharacterized protein YcfL
MKKLFLLIGCLSVVACSTNGINEHSTMVGDSGNISIKSIPSIIAPNGLLVAQANFYNSGSKAVTGFYRCKFMDAQGMNVGDDDIWQPVTIYPNATQAVKCLATQKEATNFVVEFSADKSNVSTFN